MDRQLFNFPKKMANKHNEMNNNSVTFSARSYLPNNPLSLVIEL